MDKNPPAPPDIGQQLLRGVHDLIRVQQLALLGPERVIQFAFMDHWVQLHLPLAHADKIQRTILGRHSFFEANLLLDIRSHIGSQSVVVDAGANIGNHTVYFGLICGAERVHAFEPMRVAHATLTRNIALNNLGNVTAHHKAVGAEEGWAELVRYVQHNTGSTVLDLDRPGAYPVVPIDSLRLERCDFIKMDVEGAQIHAMRGAAETLARCRPLIWVELRAAAGEIEAGHAQMQAMGYRPLRQVAGSPTDFLFGPA